MTEYTLNHGRKLRFRIKNGFVCSHTTHDVYLCYEHTTYRMEFSPMFGPCWFSVPGDRDISPEPDGTMGFLWDAFSDWYKTITTGCT